MQSLSRITKMSEIASNLEAIKNKIAVVSKTRAAEFQYFEPQLVAVSKLHPAESVIKAYEAGQRHFGENYVNELSDKANSEEILDKCKDIKWHFIGHLQRNKVNKLLGVNNLHLIETVDSDKIATALDNAWTKFKKHDNSKLNIMIQVNTSGEEAKSGCQVGEAASLVEFILQKCPNLEVLGLMTIGEYGYDMSKGPNPDFLKLVSCKKDVCEKLQLDPQKLQLSMGMSTDFEHAIELGSAVVRVGTAIFGERPKK